MDRRVTIEAQRDEISLIIIAAVAAELFVMDL